MKNKDIVLIMILFILFVVLIFTTPFMDSNMTTRLWVLFFIIIGVILLIWVIISFLKTPGNEIIEKFKQQHKIVQILDVIIVVLIVYELITMQDLHITWLILFLIIIIPFVQWFLKKEED